MSLRGRGEPSTHDPDGGRTEVVGVVAALVVLGPIAAGMAVTTAVLVRWASEAHTRLKAATVVFLLFMMVSMLAGAAIYFAQPSATSLVEGFWVASALMSASVVLVFAAFLAEIRSRLSSGTGSVPSPLLRRRAFVGSVVGLVLASEFLMGWTFSAAAGTVLTAGSGGGAGSLYFLASVVASPWFLFTMSIEMALTTVFLRSRISPVLFRVLLAQSVIMFLSPTALASPSWVALSIVLSSAAMIVLIIYLMEFIYRHRQLDPVFSRYVVVLLAIYAGMMAGQFLWLYYGGWTPLFAVSIVAEMVLFFVAILRSERFGGAVDRPWQLDPGWAVQLLATVFVAEIFMGALLDLEINPAAYAGVFFTLPLTGSWNTILYNATFNGFWFLAGVTASTWFLAMMGVEMGALLFYKFRETVHLENKIRILLTMGCYGAFTVFFPSIYYATVFPNAAPSTTVPVLGWTMGIGSAPLATSVFVVVLVSYAVTGALTALFGRRVICSVFCSAPLMYQGTTIDAMKSFNRTEWPAKKYLGSRMSTAYSVTTGLVLVSLALASAASYLDSIGVWSVTILSADPTVFLLSIYFGVLWYVMFVTIPYTGNYNCVTMGWCYTGAIAQAFHKIGFFKLKVRDKQICKDCTTLDCAKSCPVGLVDMPGHFRTRGEFRSTKCCGVGNCVGACPYNNLYISDVRHWIRDHIGTRAVPPVRARLPMATARPPGATLAGTLAVPMPAAVASPVAKLSRSPP
jgi:polyferredoxin